MKRVMRDVLTIVTTIRWLPDDKENPPPVEAFLPEEEIVQADRATTPGEAAPYSVYYTYLIVYRLLDDA